MYLVIHIYEREIMFVRKHDTREKAVEDVNLSYRETFIKLHYPSECNCDDPENAWINHKTGNYDWYIVEVKND